MKPLSAPLQALFATRAFARANLYEIVLVDGTAIRMAAYDADLTFAAVAFSAGLQGGPVVGSQGAMHYRPGLEVDELEFEVLPKDATVKGFAWSDAIAYGILDGATVKRWHAYMALSAPTVVVGRLLMFSGRLGDVSGGNGAWTLRVKSFTELLDVSLPRRLFQAPCNYTLFDAGCTLAKAAFAVAATVANGSTPVRIRAQINQPDKYFALGHVVFTGGRLAGLSKSVKAWTQGNPGALKLTAPFPIAPAAGDAFLAYPGCDLRFVTCDGTFNNAPNFGGEDFIPAPETAV